MYVFRADHLVSDDQSVCYPWVRHLLLLAAFLKYLSLCRVEASGFFLTLKNITLELGRVGGIWLHPVTLKLDVSG